MPEMRGEPRAGLRPGYLHLQHPVPGALTARNRAHQLRLVPERVQMSPAPRQLVMQSSRLAALRAEIGGVRAGQSIRCSLSKPPANGSFQSLPTAR